MVILSFSANNNVSKFFSNEHVFWERGSTLVANSFPLRLRVDSVRSHLYLCMYTTPYPQTGWCCRTVGAEHQRTGPIRPLQRAESTGWVLCARRLLRRATGPAWPHVERAPNARRRNPRRRRKGAESTR